MRKQHASTWHRQSGECFALQCLLSVCNAALFVGDQELNEKEKVQMIDASILLAIIRVKFEKTRQFYTCCFISLSSCQSIGRTLFFEHSFYNHSCAPNIFLSCNLQSQGEDS